MHRRSLLRALAGAAVLPGCLGDVPEGPSPGTSPTTDAPTATPPRPTATPTPSLADPNLVESDFAAIDECPVAGGARISLGSTVTVTGCLRGANGCSVPTLDAILFDTAREALTVVVATDDRDAREAACTQALVDLGYRVRVEFEEGEPSDVSVIHDDADGRRRVAIA